MSFKLKVVCASHGFQIFIDDVLVATWKAIHEGHYPHATDPTRNGNPLFTNVKAEQACLGSPNYCYSYMSDAKWEYCNYQFHDP